MKSMKFISIFSILLVLISCNNAGKKQATTKEQPSKWSVKMADAVMTRHDSLGFYNNRTRRGWSYDVSLVGMAIAQLKDIDPKYHAYLETMYDILVSEDGSAHRYKQDSYNIDYIRPATMLIPLYKATGKEKYKKAIPQFIEQMENHPKTKTGGYWHKKRYPWQLWLDGVYMATPFLAEYAKEFNEPKWFDAATHEIELVYEKTVDKETGLLYHAWDESKEQKWCNPETGQSHHFWSRAIGWYVMAIVDVLDHLPQDHPKRDTLIEILNKVSEALVKVRDEKTGVWFQVLNMAEKEGNYAEGSGTAMYIYAFAKGAQKGYLDKKYLDIANDAFDDMIKTFIITDEDGLISMINICASCGLGGNPYRDGSYEYYTTEKIQKNDCKGVGPFILAATQLDR